MLRRRHPPIAIRGLRPDNPVFGCFRPVRFVACATCIQLSVISYQYLAVLERTAARGIRISEQPASVNVPR